MLKRDPARASIFLYATFRNRARANTRESDLILLRVVVILESAINLDIDDSDSRRAFLGLGHY